MPVGSGYKSYASVIEETVYGTDPGTARDGYLRLVTEGLTCDEQVTDLPGLGTRDVRETYQGQRVAGGPLDVYPGYEGAWLYLLKHALGGYGYTVDTPESGVNQHVFSVSDDLPIGLSIEAMRGEIPPAKVFLYTGCKVDQMTLAWEGGGLLTCSTAIIAQDEAEDTTEQDDVTYASDLPIKYDHMGTIQIAGDTIPISGGSIVIANALGRRFLMGRLTQEPIPGGTRQITGQVTSELQDLTSYTKYKEHTLGAMDLLWEGADIGATSTPYTFRLQATVSRLTAATPNVSGFGVIEMPISFKIEAASQMTITVYNDETTL